MQKKFILCCCRIVQNVSNIKEKNSLHKHQLCFCVFVYLLFAELPDGQDVLAHQRVQQRRGLEVGHLSRGELSRA